ncbi:hypothetical protein A6769_11065 [Nostoc punctiforme NIES-2108]|uniref:Uncharacterized protein n=1 Tax=Nostoc punctiforme NIES-2108 TaxID=1356359 RepID=A0A367RLL6_NOSPU|nr:hypothetical protein A6769_11065 [Nostoc punctiforme NIES-2108]
MRRVKKQKQIGFWRGLIPFHFKNDTDGQAEGAEGAEEAEKAEEVICISDFVNWYKYGIQ